MLPAFKTASDHNAFGLEAFVLESSIRGRAKLDQMPVQLAAIINLQLALDSQTEPIHATAKVASVNACTYPGKDLA